MISIITTINAINSFKKLLEELFNQNEKLRKEYTKVIAGSNKKVSETLAKNEDVSNPDIAKIYISF